jgi:hypothetical protein
MSIKTASKGWTNDERQRLVLKLASRIKQVVQAAVYTDEVRSRIFGLADCQEKLMIERREFLESNREQIERDCGI